MKEIVTGDFHIDTLDRPGDTIRVLKYIMDYAIENRIPRISVLGDIYHKRHPRPDDQFIFHQWIKKGLSNNIKFLLIRGNHDNFPSEFLGKTYYSFGELNTFFSDKSIQIEDSGYVENNIYYGHLPLNDAIVESGNTPISNSISSKDLENQYPDVNLFLLGDIHKQQKLGKKVFYVGSPERTTFGERDDTKLFLHLTDGKMGNAPINRDRVKRIECFDCRHGMYWITTPATKMLEVIEDWSEHQAVKPVLGEDELKGAIIKVIVKIKESDAWVVSEDEIRERYRAAREVRSVIVEISDKKDRIRNENIKETTSPLQCFYEYVKEKELEEDVEKEGTKVLREVGGFLK